MMLRRYPLAWVLLLAGLSAAAFGLRSDPGRTWPNLLLDGFYVLSIGISATFFLSVQRAAGARWSAGLRRIPEAYMGILPAASVLLLAVLLGRQTLYPWAQSGAAAGSGEGAGRTVYFTPGLVLVRVVLALLVFNAAAWLLRRASREQDRRPEENLLLHHRMNRTAIAFLPLFAVAFTATAYDWILSLNPEWFSTMFAVFVFAGMFVQGIAGITLATVLVRERGLLEGAVGDSQLHDLGKMIFAFSTFWAYIWTCQYLLIWYGNIPDEVTWYLRRTGGPWVVPFALNLAVNWMTPFVVLLSARAKRSPKVLKGIALLLLAGHWLDLYVLVMPSLWSAPRFGVLEVLIAAGYASLGFLIFSRSLAGAEIVPLYDPILMANSIEASGPVIAGPQPESQA